MEHADDMTWREDAVTLVLEHRQSRLREHDQRSRSIDSINGGTLAETIVADVDVPAHDFATMDGYAFDAQTGYPYTLQEDSDVFPEDSPGSIESGEAVEIATGAPLPAGATAVLKREDATIEDGKLWGESIEPGTYVYEQGSNIEAGEVLFENGESLSAKDAILLGDLGYETVTTYRPFSAGVLATGTEIHEGRSTDLDSPMLAGLIESWGHNSTYEGSVPDEFDRVTERIAELADSHDVVVTTGGTSVGHKDYVIRALESLGDVVFHRVRIRPGKPIAMVRLPAYDATAFAIPGKPIGAHTIACFVMRAFFTGETALPTIDAKCQCDVTLGPEGFEYAIPVSLEKTPDEMQAMPLGHVDSPLSIYERQFDPSVLSSSTRASRADGIVLTTDAIAAREIVSVIPYTALE